ncbi:hypothetical protein NBO_1165g0001 [Nosema bombycis CQ1]|uniref:Uncharacterized protein n=1 Tax=Nosema bombycis (strain CQ1 / CVCC 102059) TaxID=578461 RepID=R0KLH5_NOSB1|nr:hypothetical protein NBO_1165g0001 [Nosema bombycis CQ1]|eukprot:EOB11466.1 hypothetical protein NBO_1165g0001 [Nosema bombycis CQ1]
MFKLFVISPLILAFRITIDVGYFGKKITNQSNLEMPNMFKTFTTSIYIKKYGETSKCTPEKIDFNIFNIGSYEKELQKNEKNNEIKENAGNTKLLFYSYIRMYPSLKNNIPFCPFVIKNQKNESETPIAMKNIMLIHPYYVGKSTVYMVLDVKSSISRNFISSHLMMNLVLYIFNNPLCFNKTLDEFVELISDTLKNNKVRLEFLGSVKTVSILMDNILYLIRKFNLNCSQTYNVLLNDVFKNLKEDLMRFLNVNYTFPTYELFEERLEHLIFVSIIDICNVVSSLCEKDFDYVQFCFFDSIKFSANILERCLILEISTRSFSKITNVVFEGHGDMCVKNLDFYQVGKSNTFIIGCNQLYDLYKEKINLRVILSYGLKKVEQNFNIADIIPNDNK